MGGALTVFLDLYFQSVQKVFNEFDQRTGFSAFKFSIRPNGKPRIETPDNFTTVMGKLHFYENVNDIYTRLMALEARLQDFADLESRVENLCPYIIPYYGQNRRHFECAVRVKNTVFLTDPGGDVFVGGTVTAGSFEP